MEKLKALLKKLGAKDEDIAEVESEIEADKAAEVDGLKRKNAELIKKSKETKEGEGGKVADLEAKLEDLAEQLTVAQKTSEKTLKKLTAERDELTGKLTETEKAARDFERGITLRESLSKLGVGKLNALDIEDAIAHIERSVSYEDVDGKMTARVAYKDKDGKEAKAAIGEYIEKVYPSTDHAKRFIPSPGNRGGGAGSVRPTIPGAPPAGGEAPTVKGALSEALSD